MPGTIRTFIGLLIVFGAVGGMEQSVDDIGLLKSLGLAVVGLLIAWSGTNALSKQNEIRI